MRQADEGGNSCMKTVKVDLGSDSYRIEIGRGLLSSVGEKLRQLTKAEKIAVVTEIGRAHV